MKKASNSTNASITEQKPCKCKKLFASSASGKEAQYHCKCNQTVHTIKLTKTQLKRRYEEFPFLNKKKKHIHTIFHYVQEQLHKNKDKEGYDVFEVMDQCIKKYPEIIDVHVDDDHHCGSSVYLIPHEDKFHLWGVTVLYVPQCTGEKPIRFFLYPGHLMSMIESLQVMAKIARKYGNRKLDTCWHNPKQPTAFTHLPKFLVKANIKEFKTEYDPPKPLTKKFKAELKKMQKQLAAESKKD